MTVNLWMTLQKINLEGITPLYAFTMLNYLTCFFSTQKDNPSYQLEHTAFAALSNHFINNKTALIRSSGFLIGGLNSYIVAFDRRSELRRKEKQMHGHLPSP